MAFRGLALWIMDYFCNITGTTVVSSPEPSAYGLHSNHLSTKQLMRPPVRLTREESVIATNHVFGSPQLPRQKLRCYKPSSRSRLAQISTSYSTRWIPL